jgi:hypothetical protein
MTVKVLYHPRRRMFEGCPKLMARPAISINSLERWLEIWLSPRLRLVFRAFMVLVTNAVLCLGALACINVVKLISAHFVGQGSGKELSAWTFTFLVDVMPTLNILVILIYGISIITTTFRIFFSHSE